MARPPRDDLAFIDAAARLWDETSHDVGYQSRLFAMTALPYKNPGDGLPVWERTNGGLTLSVEQGRPTKLPDGSWEPMGYPFGSIPRLLMAWLTTEVVRRRERMVDLGGTSFNEFSRQLNLQPDRSKNGVGRRLRAQTRRLLRAHISVEFHESRAGASQEAFRDVSIASAYDLWWSEAEPDQSSFLPSYVEVSERFFKEVMEHPVPIDMNAMRLLSGSPLRLDIYVWLTYRMSYLTRQSKIPWDALMAQFGSNAKSRSGIHRFQTDFAERLAQVCTVYRDANVEVSGYGVTLRPSLPHVLPKKRTFAIPASATKTSPPTAQPPKFVPDAHEPAAPEHVPGYIADLRAALPKGRTEAPMGPTDSTQ